MSDLTDAANAALPAIAASVEESRIAFLEAELVKTTQQLERFRKLDREAGTYVESPIVMRTNFTGNAPYVGWKGLGKALTEALDERDALQIAVYGTRWPQFYEKEVERATEELADRIVRSFVDQVDGFIYGSHPMNALQKIIEDALRPMVTKALSKDDKADHK